MDIALTKLSPTNRVLVGETMNLFGEDHCVMEKRGRYYLSEIDSVVILIQETTMNNPTVRMVKVSNGEIVELSGFCEGLTDLEKKEKAAELFMGFATCRRFFEISDK